MHSARPLNCWQLETLSILTFLYYFHIAAAARAQLARCENIIPAFCLWFVRGQGSTSKAVTGSAQACKLSNVDRPGCWIPRAGQVTTRKKCGCSDTMAIVMQRP